MSYKPAHHAPRCPPQPCGTSRSRRRRPRARRPLSQGAWPHGERREHQVADGGVERVVVELGHAPIVPRRFLPSAPVRDQRRRGRPPRARRPDAVRVARRHPQASAAAPPVTQRPGWNARPVLRQRIDPAGRPMIRRFHRDPGRRRQVCARSARFLVADAARQCRHRFPNDSPNRLSAPRAPPLARRQRDRLEVQPSRSGDHARSCWAAASRPATREPPLPRTPPGSWPRPPRGARSAMSVGSRGAAGASTTATSARLRRRRAPNPRCAVHAAHRHLCPAQAGAAAPSFVDRRVYAPSTAPNAELVDGGGSAAADRLGRLRPRGPATVRRAADPRSWPPSRRAPLTAGGRPNGPPPARRSGERPGRRRWGRRRDAAGRRARRRPPDRPRHPPDPQRGGLEDAVDSVWAADATGLGL